MTQKEKLAELIEKARYAFTDSEAIASFLVSHGVAVRDMSEWISVKDRMPETIMCNAGTEYSEAVVVLTEGRKVCTAIWNGRMWIGDFDFWEALDEEITHWKSVLPLPEPPEVDKT